MFLTGFASLCCNNLEFTNALYDGIEISLVNTGLLQENSITFTVGEMGSSTYNAQVMEYNLDDTVMLTSVVLDRPQEYTLSFKPNGSGVMKLLISSLADASDVIGIYGLYTTVTTYTSQNITTTICNNGGDRYRFGFNGMEKDNELKGTGNSLDFGARMYDSRLGRWLSLDPLAVMYPSMSPYNFVGNSPILFVDPDGKEIVISKMVEGEKGVVSALDLTYTIDGKLIDKKTGLEYKGTNDYILSAYNSINLGLSGKYGTEIQSMLSDLIKSREIHNIRDYIFCIHTLKDSQKSFCVENIKSKGDNIIQFNPNKDRESEACKDFSDHEILIHELRHAWQHLVKMRGLNNKVNDIRCSEIDAVNIQNQVRIVDGKDLRTTYNGNNIPLNTELRQNVIDISNYRKSREDKQRIRQGKREEQKSSRTNNKSSGGVQGGTKMTNYERKFRKTHSE